MFDDDDSFIEQMGELVLWLLRWVATFLLVGILGEFLISAFH